jgi:hypothetical protein
MKATTFLKVRTGRFFLGGKLTSQENIVFEKVEQVNFELA